MGKEWAVLAEPQAPICIFGFLGFFLFILKLEVFSTPQKIEKYIKKQNILYTIYWNSMQLEFPCFSKQVLEKTVSAS